MDGDSLKVVFLRAYDFPYGGAAQNRALAICRGLKHSGVDVEVHQYTPAKLDIKENLLRYQRFKGIPIYNHSWKFSPMKSKKDQLLGAFYGLKGTIMYLLKTSTDTKIDYIFVNNESNIYMYMFWIVSKITKAKLGRDLNEFPKKMINNSKSTFLEKVSLKIKYRWFDVIFFISQNLESYYKKLLKKKVSTLILPVSVDTDRFHIEFSVIKENTITYCGDLSQIKDGVKDLIQSFSHLLLNRKEYKNYKLQLIGANKSKDYISSLHQLCKELNIEDNVIFRGYLSYKDIPLALMQSKLLVLCRPNNKQAEGGFPTKIGEYLMSKVPVCITPLGNLLEYLEDGVNAYVAKDFSKTSFSEKMFEALNDSRSNEIALNGFNTAVDYFSHNKQGLLIKEFLIKDI